MEVKQRHPPHPGATAVPGQSQHSHAHSVQRNSVDSGESLAQLSMQSTQDLGCAPGSNKLSRSSRISYIAVWDHTTLHMPESPLDQTLPDTPALSFSAPAIPHKAPGGVDTTSSSVLPTVVMEGSSPLGGDVREAALVGDSRNSKQSSCRRPSGKRAPAIDAEAGMNDSSAATSQKCVQPRVQLCKEGTGDTECMSGGGEGKLLKEGMLASNAATVHYSKAELKAALQLMGCKARHSHKVRSFNSP